MANFGKGKVLTGKNLKEGQKQRTNKSVRKPLRGKVIKDELFSYKKSALFRGKHYLIFDNDTTGYDVRVSEEIFKKHTGKLTADEIKINAKSNEKGSLISIKSIEIIKEK